ncbi:MAG: cyclic nucleotide-binding domain-containing protein [Sulfuritalea sp.]|nr:cyclic nucleotide-binding domain-containing protein [Sulfuritalea sp.]
MLGDLSLGLTLGYLGIVLTLLSTFMKSMEPLRTVALLGNLVGMSYGYLEAVWPTFFGNLMLLPLNGIRLWEIRKLMRDMESARRDTSIAEVLLPHMKLRRIKAGTTLFHAGDIADEMLYLGTGEIHLVEIDKVLHAGTLFGEVGLFSRDSRRTQTAVCRSDCDLYGMTREQLYALYYQNPKIGFNLMGLLVENLLPRNIQTTATTTAPDPAPRKT